MLTASGGSGPVRFEPAFVRWAAAEGVSVMGTSVTTVVLPVIVYQATGSAAQTGILFALRVIPYLVFGLIAGPLADRGNRRRMIIGGNVIEGLLVATIPIAHVLGHLTVVQLYAVALLSATTYVFSDAAVFGAVPALVGPSRIAAANGLLSSIASTAEIVGPVVAGVLIAGIGATGAIWLDSASFLIAAGIQSRITANFRTAEPSDQPRQVANQVRAAWSFIRSRRTMTTLLGAGFGNSFAFGALLSLLVPYAAERLAVHTGDRRIGIIYAALGVGSLAAGIGFARLFRLERVRYLTPSTLLVSGLVAAALSATSSWPLAAMACGAFSASTTTTIMIGITYRQTVTPDSLRSSVNVIGRMIAWGGQPFGAMVGAAVASFSGVRAAFAVAATVMIISSFVSYLCLRTEVVDDT